MVKLGRSFSGIFLLIAAAALGALLIYLPNAIVAMYERANLLGEFWGKVYLVAVIGGAILLFGSLFWTIWKLWLRSILKRRRKKQRNRNPSELSTAAKQREIEENLEQVNRLKGQTQSPELVEKIDPLVQELVAKREQQTLEIVAFGTISSGKSSVLNLLAGRPVFATDIRGGTTIQRNEIPWPGMDRVILVDTPGLGEVDGAAHVHVAAEAAKDADLVLLVVDGPLRNSEFQLLKQLAGMEKRVLVCLNKSDWYTDEDREKLLNQIRRQTKGLVQSEDVVAVQAEKGFRIRHRVLPDGTTVDEKVEVPPNIEPLADRMLTVLKKEGKDLLMANLLLQSRGLVEKARERVERQLDERAWRIVDQYMWGSGGVAAVSPFPLVDLIAGAGISTKMILDLAEVYQQKVDLQTARAWLVEMGKLLVGFLGAQGAGVAAAAVGASLLKTVPYAGTIAGGLMQGFVQALITRWIGAVFIEYFKHEMKEPEGGLAGLARRKWEEVTRVEELGRLVQAARDRLGSRSKDE